MKFASTIAIVVATLIGDSAHAVELNNHAADFTLANCEDLITWADAESPF